MKRWQSLLLGVVISVATLAFALRGNDLSRIGGELARGRYLWLIPASVLIFLGLALRGFRWRALLDNRITTAHSFHIMNVGYFFNAWLPMRLGEVARSYLVTRLTPPISMFTSLSSVVVERLTDLLAVVALVVLAVSIAPVTPEIEAGARTTGLVALAGILTLLVFAIRRPLAHAILEFVIRLLPFLKRFNLVHLMDRVLDGLAALRSVRGMAVALFWTAVSWAVSVAAGFVLLYVFYDNPRPEAALLMIAVASIAIALPAVPGSVGPFELAIIVGLQAGGMVDASNPSERAFAYAILLHVLTTGAYALLGVIGLSQEGVTFQEVIRSARQAAARPKPAENAAPLGTGTTSSS